MKLRYFTLTLSLLPLSYLACGQSPGFPGDGGSDAALVPETPPVLDAAFAETSMDVAADTYVCPPTLPTMTDASITATLAPPFQKDYALYDLGAPPGVPDPLGGCTISWQDDNTLLIAGDSEDSGGGIYAIGIKRDACGHILGWDGSASLVATAPMVDANLVYLGAPVDGGTTGNLLVYSEWPNAYMGQLLAGGTMPARETNLGAIGLIAQGSLGGLGVVPSGPQAGELRGVTYPVYGGISEWHHIQISADGQLVTVDSVSQVSQMCNGCGAGGFAYVPAGSPDFTQESVLVAEWQSNVLTRVSGYPVDTNGDPIIASRFDFITNFLSPYGAYFDRVSGDYLFLQWQFTFNNIPDHVVVVRGFNKPPAPPPPPN